MNQDQERVDTQEDPSSIQQVRPLDKNDPDADTPNIGPSGDAIRNPKDKRVVLPPLPQTRQYDNQDQLEIVEDDKEQQPFEDPSMSLEANQDSQMVPLKKNFQSTFDEGAEAATVSAMQLNNEPVVVDAVDQANFDYLTTNRMTNNLNQEQNERKQQLDENILIEEIIEDEDCRFYFHGKQFQYSRRSLFCFTKKNTFRQSIVWIITHKRFDQFIVSLIIFNSILLGAKDYTDFDNETTQNQIVEKFDSFFTTAFTIECLLKVIGMGFILDEGSYLRDEWNWLDFIVVVSSLLTEIPQMKSVSSMRTFRLMRPLRTLTTMPSMKVLISTLLSSVAQLGGVLILAIFFFTIFAILGVSLWSGKIYYRCRMSEFPVNGDWEVDPTDTALCSEERQCNVNRYCGSLAVAKRNMDKFPRYFLNEEVDQTRDSMIEDLNFSYSSFNHLFTAFLTIFQCITLEGWIDVTNMYRNAYNQGFVQAYFLLCIIVCSFFVLNLTIAVMLLKYEEADNAQDSSHDQELVDYGHEINLPDSFIEFLIDQDNLQISQKAQKMIKNQKKESNFLRNLIHSDASPDTENKYYQNKLTVFFFYLVNSPIFDGLIIFIILLNTIVLAADKYPDWGGKELEMLHQINVIFTIIFTAEVVFKLIGLGVRGYVSDRFNIFDCLIVIISLVDMVMESYGSSAGGDAFAALRAFRLFRIFKIFRSGDLRTLLDSIAFTVITIKDYAILLALFIYVFALLGRSFFAGKVKFDEDGQLNLETGQANRINFEDLIRACLTVFQVMIGENWNSIMYDHMRGAGDLSCIYFISLVILGNIIMLNLFLAILLGNFDRARNLGEKKKIFDAFNSLINGMDVQLNVAIGILFDDADFTRYIEDKVLAINKEKSNEQDEVDQEEKGIYCHTNREIEVIYAAMSLGIIEQYLSGEKQVDDPFEIPEDINPRKMSDLQRARTTEILAYIKRQTNLRKQKLLFQQQLNQIHQQKQAILEQDNEEQPTSSDTEEERQDLSIIDHIIIHFQNSSLLIFPQGSTIRNCCQLCIQQDPGTVETKKEGSSNSGPENILQKNNQTQMDDIGSNMSPNKSQPLSQINSLKLDVPKPKRVQRSNRVKEGQQLQIQILQQAQSNGTCRQNQMMSTKNMQKLLNKDAQNNTKRVAAIFEGIILSLILISSITLVIDSPLANPDDPIIIFIGYLDNCFTVLFTLEAIIKIVALGFVMNNKEMKSRNFTPYILDPWNILDFIVVCASLIDFIVTIQTKQGPSMDNVSTISSMNSGANLEQLEELEQQQEAPQSGGVTDSLQALKALRALRAFRPLRMISRNKGMKLIVNALISSLPSMTNVTIVCLFLLLIFAILGVNFFKGKFQRCSIEDDPSIIDKATCLAAGGEWVNRDENFDNVLYGTRTLIELMTTEGWIDVMDDGCDGVSPTKMPEEDAYAFISVPFFVVYMIFGSQFILNLFVGVIMDNFNKIKEKEELGSLFVTEDQRKWIDAQRLGLSRKLQKRVDPPEGWRGIMFNFVKHSIFENTITIFIGLNTLVMAIRHDGMPEDMSTSLEYMNYVFAFIFNAEMIMKLIGLGYKQYFDDSWNIFDAFVVIATDIGLILNFLSAGASFSTAATVVRAFRIMRIIRLVRKSQNIKLILDTLFNIIPQITNFIGLMFLLLFIYAALGINLFSTVKHQELINEQNNFKGVGNAIVLLFRCATGEDWNKIMHELSKGIDDMDCIDDDNSYATLQANNYECEGCGATFAQIYFMSFTLLISWLIMNLSIAAVIEGLENAKLQNFGVINADNMNCLLAAWMEYDPNATGWINITDFICLIIELPPPFGNKQLNELCKSRSRSAFVRQKNLMYNENSFFLHEDKMILIKKKQILKILQAYKIQTYEGKTNQLHFKDVYQILVKKAFKANAADFEISKYLKRKMKDQWTENFKKFKNINSTGFKAHQAFASEIITQYAKRYKMRKQEQRQAECPAADHDISCAKAMTPTRQKLQDEAQAHAKLFAMDKPQYEIGFIESNEIPGQPNRAVNRYGLDQSPTTRAQAPQTRTRQKNKDENPQEFEEAESQDEQSMNQLLPQQNHQQQMQEMAQINNFRRDQIVEAPAQELGNDSMQANEFNIKMNKSITDSAQNKSENNLQIISPEDPGEGSVGPTADRRAMIAEMDNGLSWSRSHQLDPLVPNGEMHLRGSGSMKGTQKAQIPFEHQVGQPPKTANQAQNPRQQRMQNRGAPRQAFLDS